MWSLSKSRRDDPGPNCSSVSWPNSCPARLHGERPEAMAPSRNDRRRFDWMRTVALRHQQRSEEHTSELQSLMRISYAVFCLKKKKTKTNTTTDRKHIDTQRK